MRPSTNGARAAMWRHSATSASSGFAEPDTSVPPGASERPREQGRLFGCARRAWQGRRRCRPRCRSVASPISSRRSSRCNHIRAPSSSGSSADRRQCSRRSVGLESRRSSAIAPKLGGHVAEHRIEVGPRDLASAMASAAASSAVISHAQAAAARSASFWVGQGRCRARSSRCDRAAGEQRAAP